MSHKIASSQASWALLTEGVTQARVDMHRLRLMLDRALELVETSDKKDHLWQVAGDLIIGFPERLTEVERALDRTAYALVVMGEEFLRGRLPIEDRYVVDESMKVHPYSSDKRTKESLPSRVAKRFLEAQAVHRVLEASGATSAEGHFFDNPKKRETREFAQTKALSNVPGTAGKSVQEMQNADISVPKATQQARKAPPTPSEIKAGPGGGTFSTLNRHLIMTHEPGDGGLPQSRDDLPKAKAPR